MEGEQENQNNKCAAFKEQEKEDNEDNEDEEVVTDKDDITWVDSHMDNEGNSNKEDKKE